jgi:hypothetical protein
MELPKEKSIMVLMLFLILVLLMVLGCGLWSALGKASNAEALLALKPSSFQITTQYPNYPKSKTLKPLWSG